MFFLTDAEKVCWPGTQDCTPTAGRAASPKPLSAWKKRRSRCYDRAHFIQKGESSVQHPVAVFRVCKPGLAEVFAKSFLCVCLSKQNGYNLLPRNRPAEKKTNTELPN